MEDYCAFCKNHKCLKWEDYELTRHELEEADRFGRAHCREMPGRDAPPFSLLPPPFRSAPFQRKQ